MEGHERDPGSLRDSQAIEHLKSALAQGREWVPALLEAMALWTLPEEVFQGRRYRYLLDGEAFDWPLLAERLLAEVDGRVSEGEKRELLPWGQLSPLLPQEEFRRLLGPQKYNACLNYWYGVVVEDAVIRCAEEEEWKRTRSRGIHVAAGVTERAYRRIYGLPQGELLRRFQREKGYPSAPAVTPPQSKEFTYWLFKHRLKHSEGARVASDTRKGILFLQRTRFQGG